MSKTLTNSEYLLYSTIKITSLSQGNIVSYGTGFFFFFNEQENTSVKALVTNKHVIAGADEIFIKFHLASANGINKEEFYGVKISLNNIVIKHPDENVDLCAILISHVIKEAFEKGTPVTASFLGMQNIPEDSDWQYFDHIEEVTMVGCPNGLSDVVNNLPLVRRGITATSPSKSYNGRPEFMIDLACFPGSSGSPVFLYNNNNSYYDGKSKNIIWGTRLKLVGILYAGPQYTNKGEIILNKGPEFQVASMMHLGVVIKSSELKKIEQLIISLMKS
ncbi:serine protease [Acinetobacter baumannii]|nr:serine protease [Acinetobacter baumannii]